MTAAALRSDFVWTWLSDCLVSPSVVEAMVRGHITGFGARAAVAIVGKTSYEDAFSELVVTGWGGIACPASGVRLVESCPACGSLTYSGVQHWERLFDGRGWDGSDLFMVWPLPRLILATERAASLIETAKFSGVRVIPLAKMTDASEGLEPGRVSYWLDDHRLNELAIDPSIR
jgi:hypothetical protein